MKRNEKKVELCDSKGKRGPAILKNVFFQHKYVYLSWDN
jgi:hypothetical protein